MLKKIVSYIIVIVSLILLVLNIYKLDFDNLNSGSYNGIISNTLLLTIGIYLIFSSKNNA